MRQTAPKDILGFKKMFLFIRILAPGPILLF